MEVAIFCSANENLSPEYYELADSLARELAKNGHSIVFGGCDLGMMKTVAHAAREAGGRVIGVVPRIIEQRGAESKAMDVVIPCQDLTDRKAIMIDRADAIIALPGGLGTLDEVFTVAAAASIGYHRKRVVLYNMGGFWQSLIAMMDDLQARGVIRGQWRDELVVVDSLAEVMAQLG